ncbi:hypothetical protein AAZX31_01G077600 [Glycine max]
MSLKNDVRETLINKGGLIVEQQKFGIQNIKTMNLEINIPERKLPQLDEDAIKEGEEPSLTRSWMIGKKGWTCLELRKELKRLKRFNLQQNNRKNLLDQVASE